MTWSAPEGTPYKATPAPAGTKAHSSGRQLSTGYAYTLRRGRLVAHRMLQVHPDNLVHLKLAILKHLPVLGTLPFAL